MRRMISLAAAFFVFTGCVEGDEGDDADADIDVVPDVDMDTDEGDPDGVVDVDAEMDMAVEEVTDTAEDPAGDPAGDPGPDTVEDVSDTADADVDPEPDMTTTPGEDCTNPIVITMSGSTHTESGSSVGMHHDYDGPPACMISSSSLDVVYKVDISAGQNISMAYTSTGVIDCISIQKACPDTSLIGGCTCGDPTTTLEYDRDFDTDGQAYIFIWADDEKAFSFDLVITSI